MLANPHALYNFIPVCTSLISDYISHFNIKANIRSVHSCVFLHKEMLQTFFELIGCATKGTYVERPWNHFCLIFMFPNSPFSGGIYDSCLALATA